MAELPQRKNIRLHNFDYSRPGAYFITVCTEGRKNILSTIVGEGFPLPQLTKCGEIVDMWINRIHDKYPGFFVNHYVIMPNHIHLLLTNFNDSGRGNPSPTAENVIGWLKYNATKEINIILGTSGEKIFQRSFYDHIVRNQDDYNEIVKYIRHNPLRWHEDSLYSQ